MEAGWWEGGNVGVGVYLLLVSDSVFCQPSGSRRGPEREFWGGSVTVISIQLFVFFLSAKWKQRRRVREGMLGWECNFY